MNEAEIDVRSILGLLQRHVRLILATVIVTVSLAALYVFLQTPIYTANALVLVDPRQKNLLDPDVQSPPQADNARVESEVEILKAPATLLTVINEEQLVSDPEFGVQVGLRDKLLAMLGIENEQPIDAAAQLQGVLTRFSRAVGISRRGLTYVISVGVASEDPQKAARLANALAASYIRQQLDAKVAGTIGARDALSRRLGRAADEINETESRIDRFISSNLESVANESNRSDIAELRARLESFASQSATSTSLVATVGELMADRDWSSVAENLQSQAVTELSRKREELARQFASSASGSAQAVDLRQQLQKLDRELADTVNDELDRVRLQAETAQTEEDKLREQLRTTIMSSDLPNDLLVRLFQLQQEADVSRNQYQGLLQRLREVEAQAELQLPDSRIVSMATPPARPTSPRTTLILGLAAVVAVGLGVALAFLTENYVGGFGSPEQVEAVLGVQALAVLPVIASAPKAEGRAAIADELLRNPLSAYSEAVRRLRLGAENLLPALSARASGEGRGVVIMVCSAMPAEGKTTTAVALGRAFAIAGKSTLLIDCDLRRPAASLAVGLDSDVGLIDFLTEKTDPKGIGHLLAVDQQTDMRIILGGKRSSVPTDTLLSSERFKALLEASRQKFDVVILDTSPVLLVTDAQYIARSADLVIVAAKWSATPQREVLAALKALRSTAQPDARAAIVLTHAETLRSQYSYKYGGYYGSTTY